jgi:hypothetical protein
MVVLRDSSATSQSRPNLRPRAHGSHDFTLFSSVSLIAKTSFPTLSFVAASGTQVHVSVVRKPTPQARFNGAVSRQNLHPLDPEIHIVRETGLRKRAVLHFKGIFLEGNTVWDIHVSAERISSGIPGPSCGLSSPG